MKVLTECTFLGDKTIAQIEEKYNAKYVFESCVKSNDGRWINSPSAIFYTKEAHPTGSNYFAVYYEYNIETMKTQMYIANGISAVENVVYSGLEAEGEVVYSRYRHDFRTHKNGMFVDGGRDYFRFGGDQFNDYNVVKFKIVDGEVNFIDCPTVPDLDYHNREYTD